MTDLVQLNKQAPKFPIEVTEKAVKKIIQVLEEDDELNESFSVRVSCKGGGCSGILFNLDFEDEVSDTDFKKTFSHDEKTIQVVVDPHSAPYLEGVTVNFVRTGLTEGFRFEGGDMVKRTCGCGKSFSV